MNSLSRGAQLLCLGVALSLGACNATDRALAEGEPEPPLTIAEGIFAPLGEPLPSATDEQLEIFRRGREVALRRFTQAKGLGPEFNVTFCVACHERPTPGGGAARYRNFLLTGARLEDDSFVATGKSGVGLHYSLGDPARVPDDENTNVQATRNPVPFFGVGLLAELEDDVLLERADPDDEDDDGISGRPNYDRGFVGRFGLKSQTVSIEGFIRGPLFNHLGVTSNPLSNDRKNELPVPSGTTDKVTDVSPRFRQLGQAQAAAPDEPTEDDDDARDPELSEGDLFDLVSFSMLLAAPLPDELTQRGQLGRDLFTEVGCSDCHAPTLRGPRGLIPLYSDLLIHDMGDELADGIQMKAASGREFRTQPLWGVSAEGPYLHDGRADTLDQAIRFHGGEAERARQEYESLDDDEQEAIVEFLNSLGGRSQRSPGLIPPDTPLAEPRAAGGPMTALSPADEERFRAGREVFDEDFSLLAGLGPGFNGDSCRACHFEPVVGGAGPTGVNVMRQGLEEDGDFVKPPGGTMAHHFVTALGERAPVDEDSVIFEQRQTPTIMGLGLVDRITKETVVALEDPEDADGDGISGRAHILADGRLGRLGWKANVPSVAEFARDAMSAEMGITVPDIEGQTFGAAADHDEVEDPEMTEEQLRALIFFMQQLAPPPRQHLDRAIEDAGETIFAEVGCADCHVPTLETSDGESVPLFSDLLLHDVAPEGYLGIGEGQATMREFRTPPLWGLSHSGPYMHDGHSGTIEDAILRHDSEALASLDGYLGLTDNDRAALLAFLSSL